MSALNTRNLKYAVCLVVGVFLFSIVARAEHQSNWCNDNSEFVQSSEHKGCTKNNRHGKVLPVGLWQIYDPSTGQLLQELSYDQLGKFDGEVVLYYLNENSEETQPKMKEHRVFSHGIPTGVWTQWHRNGKLQEERNYVDGALHGLRKRWDESGIQDTVMCFVHGKRIPIGKCASIDFEGDANRNLASPK